MTEDRLRPDALLRWRQLREIVPVARTTVWRWTKLQKFPAPLRINGLTAWRWSDVLLWLESQREEQERVQQEREAMRGMLPENRKAPEWPW